MSGKIDKDFEMRMCFRGEEVSIEEYFICFPIVMHHYDLENLMAAPQHMFHSKNGLGKRIMLVFETDQEVAPTVFDVDAMLEYTKVEIKYDA